MYSKCLMQNICVLRCGALQCQDCKGGPFHGHGEPLDVAVHSPECGSCSPGGSAWCQGQDWNPLQGQLPAFAPPALLQLHGRRVVTANPSRTRDSRAAVLHFLPSVSCFAHSLLLYLAHAALKHMEYIIRPGMIAPGTGMGIAVAVANVKHLFLALPGMVYPRCVP